MKFFFPKDFILLDLEYTAWEGSNLRKWQGDGEYREIIEIGAIHVKLNKIYVEANNYNQLVTPKINTILSSYITNLTGISNNLIKRKGINFEEAINNFLKFSRYKSDHIYFYGDDDKVLYENIKLNSLNLNLDYLFFKNIKPYIEYVLKLKKNSVDSSDLNKFIGIKSKGKNHRALNDCRTILSTIKYILENNIERKIND